MTKEASQVWPAGLTAKLYFLLYAPLTVLMSLVGRVEGLRAIFQPLTFKPLHRFAIYRLPDLLFIAKIMSLDSARELSKGDKFKDVLLHDLRGAGWTLSRYMKGRPLVLNFGSCS